MCVLVLYIISHHDQDCKIAKCLDIYLRKFSVWRSVYDTALADLVSADYRSREWLRPLTGSSYWANKLLLLRPSLVPGPVLGKESLVYTVRTHV